MSEGKPLRLNELFNDEIISIGKLKSLLSLINDDYEVKGWKSLIVAKKHVLKKTPWWIKDCINDVQYFELSVRTSNVLKANNIITLWDLVKNTEYEMLKLGNFGRKSLLELKDELSKINLSFGVTKDFYEKWLQAI